MLFIGGHCEDDVKQGGIGNCWFVASVACFALHEKLVKKVRMLLLEGDATPATIQDTKWLT